MIAHEPPGTLSTCIMLDRVRFLIQSWSAPRLPLMRDAPVGASRWRDYRRGEGYAACPDFSSRRGYAKP